VRLLSRVDILVRCLNTIEVGLIPVASYISHVGSGGKINKPSECEIVEFDISALDLEFQTSDGFPEDLPDISGVVVCYDATRAQTLESIPEALRTCARLRGL
jgi:hypothetical protein